MPNRCTITAIFSPNINTETPDNQKNHTLQFDLKMNSTVQLFFTRLSEHINVPAQKLQAKWLDEKGEEHYIDLENDDPNKKLSDCLPQHYLRNSARFTILIK